MILRVATADTLLFYSISRSVDDPGVLSARCVHIGRIKELHSQSTHLRRATPCSQFHRKIAANNLKRAGSIFLQKRLDRK